MTLKYNFEQDIEALHIKIKIGKASDSYKGIGLLSSPITQV